MISRIPKTYLQGGLDLKAKTLQGFDAFIANSYYAVTKKGIIRAINKIKAVKTHVDFPSTKGLIKYTHSKLSKSQIRKNERVAYWSGKKAHLIGVSKSRSEYRLVSEKQRQSALAVCQFILDNFETLQRNKRSFYMKTWGRKNPDKVNTKSKVSGKKRKLRVPKWLTNEQIAYMDAVHMEAKALRKGGLNVHVDHIIPLCGDNISGLHVPENLEIVPALDNLLKNNTWEVA